MLTKEGNYTAKGDDKRAQDSIDYYGGLSRNRDNAMWSNYQNAVKKDTTSYDQIMKNYQDSLANSQNLSGEAYGGYQGMANGQSNLSMDPKFMAQLDSSIGGYQNFADTGGFSQQDLANLRARAISPTRAVYANAQRNVDRQRSLQGGYSPNYTAATAKMARDQAAGISDANVNANASIADMVQRGKQFGLQGLSQTSLAEQGLKTQIDSINAEMKRSGLAGMTDIDKARLAQSLSAMSGMSSLYSATPGQSSVFGNQALESQRQGLDLIRAQIAKGQMPGKFSSGLGTASSILGLLGKGSSLWKYFMPGGKGDSKGYVDANGFDPYGNYIGTGIWGSPDADPTHE